MIVLASASPRRRELLTQAGFGFEVWPADIDESLLPGEDAVAYVTRLARGKAEAVFAAVSVERPGAVVLGADTSVTVDGEILGKPASEDDAVRMLRMLSGKVHRVITGVAVVRSSGAEVSAEVTEVEFLRISEREILDYVATGEPMDKAGAYAIQGYAARWIPRISGCYFNVVGLPISLVASMLGR
jgi:septum formation protein